MAATVVQQHPNNVFGNRRVSVCDVTFDNSYPTGGLAVTPAQLNLQTVRWALAHVITPGANGPTNVHYDEANSKLKAYTATAEVSNATDLSAVTVRVTAYGY